MSMRHMFRPALFILALVAILSPPARGADIPTLLFSYEVLNFDVHKIDPAKMPYDDRLALTEEAAGDELPKIIDLLGLAGRKMETLVMPGGYKLETNASLQSSFEVDAATADKFASALGYAFRQWSVLVTDFTPSGKGDTAYGVIVFDHVVSGPEAQAFFKHAASVNPALGQGFTAFDEEMFFLNVTDAQGKPYSGVDDASFISDLGKAAETYKADKVSLGRSGRADARFLENDWSKSPEGEDYGRVLGDDLAAKLKPLRATHDADIAKAVAPN